MCLHASLCACWNMLVNALNCNFTCSITHILYIWIHLSRCSSGLLCMLMCTHGLVSAHEMSHMRFSLHLWSLGVECKVSPNSYSNSLPLCGLGLLCMPPLTAATVKHLTLFTRRTLTTYAHGYVIVMHLTRSGYVLKQYNTDMLPGGSEQCQIKCHQRRQVIDQHSTLVTSLIDK